MDALTLLKERRSVRVFSDKKVDRDIMKDLIKTATYAPSWANSQPVRYTIVEDPDLLRQIAEEGYTFPGNSKVLQNAVGAVVLSYTNGKSGYSPDGKPASTKGDTWSMFDAGIAAQQFCLAAYEKGIGTVMQGLFDEQKIAKILDLPKEAIVAVVIPYGYETKHPVLRPRLSVDEVACFK